MDLQTSKLFPTQIYEISNKKGSVKIIKGQNIAKFLFLILIQLRIFKKYER